MMHDVHNTCNWGEARLCEDDLFCIFDEKTPVKDCLELGHQPCGFVDLMELDASEEELQLNRRRMLKFSFENDNYSSMPDELSDDFNSTECTLSSDDMDRLVAEWLVDSESNDGAEWSDSITCVENDNASGMHGNFCQADAGVNHNEHPSDCLRTPKGRAALKAPQRENHSVAYPFTLIKGRGSENGTVTLDDINQRIQAPSKYNMKHKIDKKPNPSSTSALTGKPIVLKTKIHTEGRRGSITVSRTKG